MVKKAHTSEQIAAFLDELKKQTDRGAAIISAAVLDELLQLVILARLVEIGKERKEALFDKMGAPLAPMSAKVELAFALGIITNDARLALHVVREVRNKFAHRFEAVSFDHSEVAQIIDTRAPEHLKRNARLSRRAKLLMTFQAIAVNLYGTLTADIRIKTVGETHKGQFRKMITEAIRTTGLGSNLSPEKPSPHPHPSKRVERISRRRIKRSSED